MSNTIVIVSGCDFNDRDPDDFDREKWAGNARECESEPYESEAERYGMEY